MPKSLAVRKKLPKASLQMLKRHSFIFKTLSSVRKNRRNLILKNSPTTLFTTLKLLFKGLLNGKIPLTIKQKNKLTKSHKHMIRVNSNLSTPAIKTNMLQSGEGLSKILKVVLPILGSVVTRFL